MRSKAILLLAVCVLALSTVVPAGAKAPRTKVVATDVTGDWGADIDPQLAPVGAALGQDLVSASIAQSSATIDFSLTTTSLQDASPRAGVFVWDMTVDGDWWRLSNFVCDPSEYVGATPTTPDACAPPAGTGYYFEVLLCGGPRVVNVSANCSFRTTVEATVDTAAATITIPVAAELLGVHSGSRIAPMSDTGKIWSGTAFPYGGSTGFPGDVMTWDKAFRVR